MKKKKEIVLDLISTKDLAKEALKHYAERQDTPKEDIKVIEDFFEEIGIAGDDMINEEGK